MSSYDGTGSNTLVTGAWYRLALVVSAAGLLGYVNGQLDGSAVGGNCYILSTGLGGLNYIGQDAGTGGRFFNGAICDVRLYQRVLSPGEINTDYNQTLAAANQPEGELPVLYYPSAPASVWCPSPAYGDNIQLFKTNSDVRT